MSDIAKLKNWILEYMSSLLSIEVGEIDPSQRLSYYGLNSKNSIQFVMELSALVNREYDATLVWDYPTVNDLVEFLSNTASKNKQAISHKTGQIDGKEPIAIVGIGCRFPNAQNKSAYWDLLKNNFSGIRKVPEEKWNSSDYFDEDIAAPGKMNTQYGGFLDNLYDFDPEFFGISPKEAKYIDPQQRLVLEVTWEALDDAGVEIKKLKGSKTGVFNGAIWSDYAGMCQKLGDEKINKYTATGNHHSIISNRVSYLLGLQGPSMTIDTACSSSLVAVHLAAQSLRSGETDMALAGGVNLILSPEGTLSMSKLGAMAPDGQSKAFDKRANGYVRGEGAGVIVLKRLSSAIKDGDRIYSVILNSANNNDGFSNGLTAPSPQAQEKVLRAAYEGTGLEPDDVRFIEAHGTGTKLGDPIEAKAIGKVLGEQRKPTNPLVLGSVKSQIGHLEGAAGIAGLIKLALSIKNRVIPANLNFDEPNPDIPFEKYNLRVADQPLNWPDKEKAIGGVTSIGFGGSNCHVVLSEYQRTLDNLLVVSGKDISQAKSKLEEISIELREVDSGDFRRLCYQFNKMYTPSSTNVAIVFSDLEDLAIKIEKVGKEDNEEIIISESHRPQRPLVFVCSGQGAKWSGTVKQLYKVNTVFRSVISKCDKELEKYTRSFSIADFLLNGETGDQNSAEVLQPSYVAIQIALSELWKSWGVSPDALIGHSLGELSSAYIGGFLSLADTMKVAYYRGLQYEKVIAEGKGLTALVSLTEEQISAYIKDYNGKVEIVVSNSKQSNVVSGDIEAMEELLAKFEKDGVENRKLNIGNMGAHSYLMEGITDEFYDQISDIRPLWGDTDFYSTALDCKLSPYDYDRSYWVRNIRNHVKFSSVVDKLLPADPIFLELGPHPILTEAVVSISKNNERNDAVSLFSLKKGIPDQTSMYLNLATLATEGYKVSFSKVFGMENTDEETVDTLIPISAHTSKALINEAVSITKGLDKKEYSSDDLVYSITKNRVSFNNKLALTVNKNTTFSEIEDALKNGGYHTNLIRQEKSIKNKKIAFVFSGQGSQYLNLGIGLYKSYEVFRNKISECSLILKSKFNLNWDLKDLILTETNADLLTETEVLQPVIFSIQVALAELWKSFGIIPDGVVGHSLGEIAAAHVSGTINLQDALVLVVNRGQLMQQVKGKGFMIGVRAPLSTLNEFIQKNDLDSKVEVAVENSDESIVLAANQVDYEYIVQCLKESAFKFKVVSQYYAFHSSQLSYIEGELPRAINNIEYTKPEVPLYSSSKGKLLSQYELNSRYWVENCTSTVSFREAISLMSTDGYNVYLEIGPHPDLLMHISKTLENNQVSAEVVYSLKKGGNEVSTILSNVAKFYTLGVSIDWDNIYVNTPKLCTLPVYSFQRATHNALADVKQKIVKPPKVKKEHHPLLGERQALGFSESIFFNSFVDTSNAEYLNDFRYGDDSVIFPLAAILEMSWAAACYLGNGMADLCVSDLELIDHYKINDSKEANIQFVLDKEDLGFYKFKSYQIGSDNLAKRGAKGAVIFDKKKPISHVSPELILPNLTKRNDTSSSGDSLYPRINLADWVEEFYFDDLNILAKLDDKKSKALETGFYSNTVLLESIFKLISQELSIKSYPESIKRFRIFKPIDKEVWVHITHDSSSDAHVFNIKVIDVEGEVYLEIDGVKYEEIDRLNYPTLSDEIQEFNLNQKIFKVAEQQLNLADKAIGNRGSDFVIFGSPGNAVNHIPEIFQSADIKCIKVNYGDQFCKIDDRNYCIDPMNADDYDQLWKSLEGVQISDVLHSFSVKSGDSQSNEIHSVFNLIKSVNKLDLLNSSLGLTLVSNVGNEFYSALRGLSKVISQEDLFTSVNHIEINDDVSNRQLISEALFTDAHGNHTITLKQEDVFSTGLELIKNTCSTDTDFDKNKFCLITGGSGDLSEDIIQSLRDLGLNRFVLISRRGNSDCQIKKMQLRYGVEAQSIQADVADLSDLKKKLANFAGQIGGVVHAAGFLKPDILSDQSFSDFSDHMIPKVRGLTNLSKITSGEKIDYFVCFSSLSSIIGGKGLGAYATANSAVDILMQQRAKQNLASTSINWGPIEGTSMAEQIPISNAHTGIRGLSRSDFRDILKKVILNKDEQILAVNVDFDQFKKVFHFNQESEEPFEKLKFEQLITLDENQLSNQILDVVQNLVEGLLGLKMLATDKNLFDVGIDSLMLTELRGLILKYFNVSISMALFYSKPTLIEITNEITNKIIDMKTDVKDYQGVAI